MPKDNPEDIIKAQREKELKEIAGRLAKFKSDKQEPGKETLESRMPSRDENAPIEIKIPSPKREKREQEADLDLHNRPDFVEDKLDLHSGRPSKTAEGDIKNISSEQEDSRFGGIGISRKKLKHEMIVDPEIKKAARITRLGLSPSERAGLVKKVFTRTMGSNISEKDLDRGIHKLNRQLRSTAPSSEEHRLIRKEIKFFKKISEK